MTITCCSMEILEKMLFFKYINSCIKYLNSSGAPVQGSWVEKLGINDKCCRLFKPHVVLAYLMIVTMIVKIYAHFDIARTMYNKQSN